MTDWFDEWTAPVPWEPTDDYLINLRSHRNWAWQMMTKFPISCVVRVRKPKLSDDPEIGITSTYIPREIGIRRNPYCIGLWYHNPEDLEILGYWKNVTPEIMSIVFSDMSVSEIQQKLSGLGGK